LQKQTAIAEDTPQLTVIVNPTRSGDRQLAQIRVLNVGRRPVHLTSWFYSSPERHNNTTKTFDAVANRTSHADFPVVLGEQQHLDVLGDLHETTWESMTQIGVVDRSQRYWTASSDGIARFIRTAKESRGEMNRAGEGRSDSAPS